MVNIVCLLSTTSSQTVREMIKFSRDVPKRNPEDLCLLATLDQPIQSTKKIQIGWSVASGVAPSVPLSAMLIKAKHL